MKKRLISAILAIVMLLTISPFVYAETVLLDRSLPEFENEETLKTYDYYGSTVVRGSTSAGNGNVSLADVEGNKMIKLSVTGEAEGSSSNYAAVTMFTSTNLVDYYKNGMIISFDIMVDNSYRVSFYTRGTSYYTNGRLFVIDNGVLIPAIYADGKVKDETDPDKHAIVSTDKMHNLKLVVDVPAATYKIYLDGNQVGDAYKLGWLKSEGFNPFSIALLGNESTASYPIDCYIDNLKLISYKENGIEVASDYDISDDGTAAEEFNPGSDKHSVGFDIFNNNTGESDIVLASLKYKANENGFKSLEGYNIRKSVLTPVHNRIELSKMLIPENDETSSSKLLFMSSLHSPGVTGAMYEFTNDGTSITEVKKAVKAGEAPAKGTVEVTNLDREVTVKGHVEDTEALPLSGLSVGMVVLNKDKTGDDLIVEADGVDGEADSISSMIYLDASETDSEGNYSFKIEMPETAEMGDYVIISRVGNTEYTTTMRYLTSKQKQAAVKAVNESLDKALSDFITVTEENEFPLSLFVDYSSTDEMFDIVKTKSTFMDLIKSYGYYPEDIAEVADSVNKFNKNLDNAILLSYMESIDDIDMLKAYAETYAEQTGLDLSGITETNRDFVYTALSVFDDFSSLDKINTHIAENIVIFDIPSALNWGSIRKTIETYADYLSLDMEAENVEYNDIYREMFKVKFKLDNIGEIKETFEKLIKECQREEEQNQIPQKRPSGSGGGGGGRGGIASTPVVTPEAVVSSPEETVTPEIPEPEFSFKDVDSGHWGYNSIKELYRLKLINGVSDTEFAPQNNIRREEFVALLARMAGLENSAENAGFSDVASDAWYKDVLNAAYSKGIISGKPDGSFGAGENVTRQDMAVMINNMADKGIIDITDTGAEISFSDKESISGYAEASVEIAVKAGIITGYTDSTFRPLNNATRAEAAAIILRIYNLMQK